MGPQGRGTGVFAGAECCLVRISDLMIPLHGGISEKWNCSKCWQEKAALGRAGVLRPVATDQSGWRETAPDLNSQVPSPRPQSRDP